MKKTSRITRETAELLAIQALTFLGEDPVQLGRFLALSGIGPEDIRAAAYEPGFLAGVLEHIAGNEALLVGFAGHADIDPSEIGKARAALTGPNWEREAP
jgi:hypothetical protein